MVGLDKIFSWFKNGLEPDEVQFKESWSSFWHKSERLPQTQVLGLNEALANKASKEDLSNVVTGLVPMGNALNIADLNTKPKRNNDSYYVLDQLDENGDPYIFRYDAELAQWINTKQVVYKNVATKPDVEKKADKLAFGIGFLKSSAPELTEFANTIRDISVLVKYDRTAEPGNNYLQLSAWGVKSIGGGIYNNNGWVHTFFGLSPIGKYEGLDLYHVDNEYFEIYMLADSSKRPVISGYPSIHIWLDAADSNNLHTAINDARLSIETDSTKTKISASIQSIDAGITPPSFGYLPDSAFAKEYRGDFTALCLYRNVTTGVSFDLIKSQIKYLDDNVTNVTAILKFTTTFNSLSPTYGGTVIFTKELSKNDFDAQNNLILVLPEKYEVAQNGNIVLFVAYETGNSAANGICMNYLSLGNPSTPPEHRDELQSWYRQSGLQGSNSWSFFNNNGTYAYQYTIPLVLTTQNVYFSELNSVVKRLSKLESGDNDTSKFYSRSVLPSALHAAVGLEFNLYFDGFNLLPDYGSGEPDFMINIQSEIESSWRGLHYRSYRRMPVVGDIGNHTLTIDYYNNKNQILSSNTPDERFRTALRVVAKANPDTQKRVLIIGDSTNEGGNVAKRIYQNFQEATGVPPIMLGTRFDSSKTWKHEARTEKTYGMFANGETVVRIDFTGATFTQDDIVTLPYPKYNVGGVGVILRHLWKVNPDGTGYAIGYNVGGVNTSWSGVATKMEGGASMPVSVNVTKVSYVSGWSPFKNNEGTGILDFAYYRTQILELTPDTKIDLMFADLGINDVYTGGKSETDITNIVNNAKKIIDAYLADGNGKFAVCYPKSRSSAIATSDRRHYPMRFDMQRLRERLIQEFDNNPAYPDVYICGSGMQLDRWYGYPMATANVAARIAIQETKPVEGVHPVDAGYQQVGDAMTATAWYLLNQ